VGHLEAGTAWIHDCTSLDDRTSLAAHRWSIVFSLIVYSASITLFSSHVPSSNALHARGLPYATWYFIPDEYLANVCVRTERTTWFSLNVCSVTADLSIFYSVSRFIYLSQNAKRIRSLRRKLIICACKYADCQINIDFRNRCAMFAWWSSSLIFPRIKSNASRDSVTLSVSLSASRRKKRRTEYRHGCVIHFLASKVFANSARDLIQLLR